MSDCNGWRPGWGNCTRLWRRGAIRGSTLALVAGAAVSVVVVGVALVRGVGPAEAEAEDANHGAELPGANGSSGGGSAKQADEVADQREVEAVLEAVQVYYRNQEWAKAEAVLSSAVTRFADDADLHLAYADLLLLRGRPDEAYKEITRGIELGANEARTHFQAGVLALQLDQPGQAASHFATAQRIDPTNGEYPLYLGQVQMTLGMMNEAKANLVISAELDPSRAVVWGAMAQTLLAENRPSLALQQVRKARELEPDAPGWRLIEARALKRMGRVNEAITTLEAIPQGQRTNIEILRTLAETYGLADRPDDAARVYAQAVGAQPDEAELVYQAALWAERAGELTRARIFASQAADLGHALAPDLVARLNERAEAGD